MRTQHPCSTSFAPASRPNIPPAPPKRFPHAASDKRRELGVPGFLQLFQLCDPLCVQHGVSRDAQLAAEVEQILLYAPERFADVLWDFLGEQHAERRIQLVDVAEGLDARAVLRQARAVAEAGLARVAGARGDLGEAVGHAKIIEIAAYSPAHSLSRTSLSSEPCDKRVVMRSPSRTCADEVTTFPCASRVML